MGRANGIKHCPVNILSVSLLIKVGAIVHFEKDNSYFQPRAGAEKYLSLPIEVCFNSKGRKLMMLMVKLTQPRSKDVRM